MGAGFGKISCIREAGTKTVFQKRECVVVGGWVGNTRKGERGEGKD